jgi:hypothetical protein
MPGCTSGGPRGHCWYLSYPMTLPLAASMLWIGIQHGQIISPVLVMTKQCECKSLALSSHVCRADELANHVQMGITS